jgi:hypothetical protein
MVERIGATIGAVGAGARSDFPGVDTMAGAVAVTLMIGAAA